MNFHSNEDVKAILQRNIESLVNDVKGAFVLRMDELALTPRARYNSAVNEFAGFCCNHIGDQHNLKFNSWSDLKPIKQLFVAGKLHLAKEALFFTIGRMGTSDYMAKPVLILPICSHKYEEQGAIVRSIIDIFSRVNPAAKILTVATDGDPFRRRLLNDLRWPSSSNENLELKGLHLFDNRLLLGSHGINFDAKHLAKRLRGILISEKREIKCISRSINKSLLKLCIPDIPDDLLNPKDYQNVPSAVKLMRRVIEFDPSKPANNPFQQDLYKEIGCLGKLFDGLLSIFNRPDISIHDQLLKLARTSHMLFFIYRRWRTKFITNDLYQDLQSTIQDAFNTAAIFRSQASTDPVLLHQSGTDHLEALFSSVRTVTHARNRDILETFDRVRIALQIEMVYLKHPDWRTNTRLSAKPFTTDDHSSARDWTGDLNVLDLNLRNIWQNGADEARRILEKLGFQPSELNFPESGNVTMLRPFG